MTSIQLQRPTVPPMSKLTAPDSRVPRVPTCAYSKRKLLESSFATVCSRFAMRGGKEVPLCRHTKIAYKAHKTCTQSTSEYPHEYCLLGTGELCVCACKSHVFVGGTVSFITYKIKRCYNCFIISESTQHDVIAVHIFQMKLIEFLTEKSEGTCKRIIYFSDCCAIEYRNCKNFLNLCWHLVDFGMPAEWHFFATSHSKSAADGAKGTLKRLATKASLQHAYKDLILTVPVCC